MEFVEYLKNPITLSLLSGLIVFIYLWYNVPEEQVLNDSEKHCFNLQKLKQINWLLPLTTALVVWFILSCCLSNDNILAVNSKRNDVSNSQIPSNYGSKYERKPSYNLVKKGQKMNRVDLPDLFMEVDGYQQL